MELPRSRLVVATTEPPQPGAVRVGGTALVPVQISPQRFSSRSFIVDRSPTFLLEAQEGRIFHPLARTKILAVGFSSLLAITLVNDEKVEG